MGFASKTEYAQHAIKFANTIDKKNCVSFIDKNDSTYKYNKKTNELVVVHKDGTVITYFKPKGRKEENVRRRRLPASDSAIRCLKSRISCPAVRCRGWLLPARS